MTLLLTESDVRTLLDMPAALEAVEESLRREAAGEVWSQPRRRLELPGRVFLNDMTAADRVDCWFGAKLYSVAQGNARFIVPLFSGRTGELTALIEANVLGQMRTGAATGIATRYMSRNNSRVLGMIGAGLQARTQLLAVSHVRKLDQVRVYSRDAGRRATFCAEMSERLNLEVEPVDSAESAVRDADIIVTATNSIKPVLLGSWIRPGAHINAMGANMAKRCELDREAVDRAEILAVDSIEQSKIESGDLIQAFGEYPSFEHAIEELHSRGVLQLTSQEFWQGCSDVASRWNKVVELAPIVAGKIPGRTGPDQITLFKSNGIAAWDIAAAAKVVERAKQQNRGTQISLCEH